MDTSPPDQAWRLKAACSDVEDPTIFDMMDSEEVKKLLPPDVAVMEGDLHPATVAKYNRLRFYEAKKTCARCEVREECNEEAIFFGDTAFGVRGGLSPYDRPDVRPGYPPFRTGAVDAEREKAHQRAWKRFMQGYPSGEGEGAYKAWLLGEKKALMTEARAASWAAVSNDAYKHPAGEGWAISQDPTSSVVMVMYITSTGPRSRFVSARRTVYDGDITPKELEYWPEGVDTA